MLSLITIQKRTAPSESEPYKLGGGSGLYPVLNFVRTPRLAVYECHHLRRVTSARGDAFRGHFFQTAQIICG